MSIAPVFFRLLLFSLFECWGWTRVYGNTSEICYIWFTARWEWKWNVTYHELRKTNGKLSLGSKAISVYVKNPFFLISADEISPIDEHWEREIWVNMKYLVFLFISLEWRLRVLNNDIWMSKKWEKPFTL